MKRLMKIVLTILICVTSTLVYPITIIKADADGDCILLFSSLVNGVSSLD